MRLLNYHLTDRILQSLALPQKWGVAAYIIACLFEGQLLCRAELLYSNATPGPPGIFGLTLGNGQLTGMRFSLGAPTIIDGIGGNMLIVGGNGRIFGALVKLSDLKDYPNSTNMSSPDVLATVTFSSEATFTDIAIPITPVVVGPGNYAVVFGSDQFGATGIGALSVLNQNHWDASTFIYSTYFDDWMEYGPEGGLRFTVYGSPLSDTTAPEIISIDATPRTLWPPNHQMIPLTVFVDALDDYDPHPTVRISRVTCNESKSSPESDWDITGPNSVSLRATRSGKGEGRIYTIDVECEDASGNTSQASVDVIVPHSRGH